MNKTKHNTTRPATEGLRCSELLRQIVRTINAPRRRDEEVRLIIEDPDEPGRPNNYLVHQARVSRGRLQVLTVCGWLAARPGEIHLPEPERMPSCGMQMSELVRDTANIY